MWVGGHKEWQEGLARINVAGLVVLAGVELLLLLLPLLVLLH